MPAVRFVVPSAAKSNELPATRVNEPIPIPSLVPGARNDGKPRSGGSSIRRSEESTSGICCTTRALYRTNVSPFASGTRTSTNPVLAREPTSQSVSTRPLRATITPEEPRRVPSPGTDTTTVAGMDRSIAAWNSRSSWPRPASAGRWEPTSAARAAAAAKASQAVLIT